MNLFCLKHIVLVSFALCLLKSGYLYAAESYTLDELCRIALTSAEQIKIAEENVVLAEQGRDKALSAFLPKISAFGDYTRYDRKKSFPTPYGSFTTQPESSTSWGIRLGQSLSLGGKEITAFNITQKAIESSQYDLYSVREGYVFRIAEAYYDVLKATKAVEIAKANVRRLQKYRDEARTRLKVGEVSKTALLRAEAELSGAESGLVITENILKLSKAVLARLSGIQEDFELNEPSKLETGVKGGGDTFLENDLQTLSALKDVAMRERAEIKSLNLQKVIAGRQVVFAKGSYWPILSLEGLYARRDEDPSSSSVSDETLYGVLRLEVPLFEGGLRRAEIREAEAKKRRSELSYDDLKKTIGIEVENAYLEIKTQAGILKALEDQLKFARENYDAVLKQFEFGLASSIDVIDANTLLVDSERELIRTIYNNQVSMLRLKRSTGTLLKTIAGGPSALSIQ